MQSRPVWQDRFTEPTVSTLRKTLPPEATKLFDALRKKLGQIDDASEACTWYGDGWHWTLEYRLAGQDDPLLVIIPNPEDLQIGIPMTKDFLAKLPLGGMKRTIREGLDLAREPFDNHWGVWTVQFPSMVDDLVNLLHRKIEHTTTG